MRSASTTCWASSASGGSRRERSPGSSGGSPRRRRSRGAGPCSPSASTTARLRWLSVPHVSGAEITAALGAEAARAGALLQAHRRRGPVQHRPGCDDSESAIQRPRRASRREELPSLWHANRTLLDDGSGTLLPLLVHRAEEGIPEPLRRRRKRRLLELAGRARRRIGGRLGTRRGAAPGRAAGRHRHAGVRGRPRRRARAACPGCSTSLGILGLRIVRWAREYDTHAARPGRPRSSRRPLSRRCPSAPRPSMTPPPSAGGGRRTRPSASCSSAPWGTGALPAAGDAGAAGADHGALRRCPQPPVHVPGAGPAGPGRGALGGGSAADRINVPGTVTDRTGRGACRCPWRIFRSGPGCARRSGRFRARRERMKGRPDGTGRAGHFHVSRSARRTLRVHAETCSPPRATWSSSTFMPRGRFTQRINEVRKAAGAGPQELPARRGHERHGPHRRDPALRYRAVPPAHVAPEAFAKALAFARSAAERERRRLRLRAFQAEFPARPGADVKPAAAPEVTLEEMLMLSLANANRAFQPVL